MSTRPSPQKLDSVHHKAFSCTKRLADEFGTPEGLSLYPIAGNGERPPKVGFAWTSGSERWFCPPEVGFAWTKMMAEAKKSFHTMAFWILFANFDAVNFGTMMKDVKVIIFDADDTLWDNQSYFDKAEDVFTDELKEYGTAEELSAELFKTESANMPTLGYGAKAVCISMMETALKVSDNKVPGENLSRILSSAKSLLRLPATPLPGVEDTLKALKGSDRYRLVVLTKGDMLDQENKLMRSGLSEYFDKVEVVSNKGKKEYLDLCQSEDVSPEDIAMVGNSFKSDIQPVIEIGGYGIHIPFHTLWQHEVTEEFDHPNIIRLDSFDQLTKVFLD